MNKLLLLLVIIALISSPILIYAAGTSPVYSIPELSEMIDNLTLRVIYLETQIIIDETKEAQDFATSELDIDDLRQYVIPDYDKLPIIKSFSVASITESYRIAITDTFTIQSFYTGERTQVGCVYEGHPFHQIVIDHKLGLTTITHQCFLSIGSTGSVTVQFSGAINKSYVLPLPPL